MKIFIKEGALYVDRTRYFEGDYSFVRFNNGLVDIRLHDVSIVKGEVDPTLIANEIGVNYAGADDLYNAILPFFSINSGGAEPKNVNITNSPLSVLVSNEVNTMPALNTDAFGSVRTSSANRRLDVEFKYGLQPEIFMQKINGAASVTFNTTSQDVSLKVNNTGNGSSAEHICKFDIPYTAGSSQLVELTGTADKSEVNALQAFVFLRDGITGTTTEIPQANWLNSVLDVNWATSQIFAMDFQSLKVGRIRYYLNRGGVAVKVHEIVNDNIRAHGYWQDPNQPPVWRIYNTATETITEIGYDDGINGIGFRFKQTTNADAETIAICCAVKSEGGGNLFEIEGIPTGCDLGITSRLVATTALPVLSVRAKAIFNGLHNKTIIIPIEIDIQTDNDIHYYAVVGGTLTGAVWSDVGAQSASEFDRSATAITGGKKIIPSYLAASGNNRTSSFSGFLGKAVLSAARGTSDIVSLVAIRTSGNSADVFAAISLNEIQ